MNNEKLKLIAEKVISKANLSNNEKFGSVVIILMIISVILTTVRILQECNKTKGFADSQEKYAVYGEQIKTLSNRRGWFTKMRIKKILRKEMTHEDYIKYSIPLVSGILEVGENLTEEEIITLIEASNV